MVCVWPMLILVNMTYCFIYLYFFSGSFPVFLSSVPAPGHPLSVVTVILSVIATISYVLSLGKLHTAVCYVLSHVCVCLSCWDPEVIVVTACTCAPPLRVCTLSCVLFAPTGLCSDTLPGSASGCPQNGDDSHCHHVGHFFSRLACDGKEGFWLLENSNRRPRLSPPLCPTI